MGYLKSVFDNVETSWVARTASKIPDPIQRPDVILNLIGARNRSLLSDIDDKAKRYGIAVSPPSKGAWRTEDKRTYIVDFPDVSPPTRIARNLADVIAALRDFGEIVIKDPFGRRGHGVERINSDGELSIAEWLLENTICNTRELIAQPFLSGFAKGDKRVIAQRLPDNSFAIIGYIFRKPPPGGWKSNISLGGQALRTELTSTEANFVLGIAPRTGIDNVTLDIGEHEGRLFYIEHNQAYGGIVDFDLDRGMSSVSRCAEFLLHVAQHGRPD